MASQAWLWSVYEHMKETPRDELFAYFRGQGRKDDLTALIVNEASQLIKMVFPGDSPHAVSPHPERSDMQMNNGMCANHLFYCVLEHVLRQNFPSQQGPESEANVRRFKARARPPAAPGAMEALSRVDLHLSLLVCALEVVAAVSLQDDSKQFPWAMLRSGRQLCGASLWMAINCFLECFDEGSVQPMPEELQQYLRNIQTALLESFVMATGFTLYEHISSKGGGFMYGESDSTLLRQVMAAYDNLALSRTLEVASALLEGLPQDQKPLVVPPWPLRCAAVMDALLGERLELCYGQHLSVVVACVVYVVAKVHKICLTFKRILQVMVDLLPWHNEEVFSRAEISPPANPNDPASAKFGDVRDFYNGRFIEAMGPVARRTCAQLDTAPSAAAARAAAAAATPDRVAENAGTTADAGSAGGAVATRLQKPVEGAARRSALLVGASEGKENEADGSQSEVSLLVWQQTQVTQSDAQVVPLLSPARVTPHGVPLGRLLQGKDARQGTPSRASGMR